MKLYSRYLSASVSFQEILIMQSFITKQEIIVVVAVVLKGNENPSFVLCRALLCYLWRVMLAMQLLLMTELHVNIIT